MPIRLSAGIVEPQCATFSSSLLYNSFAAMICCVVVLHDVDAILNLFVIRAANAGQDQLGGRHHESTVPLRG